MMKSSKSVVLKVLKIFKDHHNYTVQPQTRKNKKHIPACMIILICA